MDHRMSADDRQFFNNIRNYAFEFKSEREELTDDFFGSENSVLPEGEVCRRRFRGFL